MAFRCRLIMIASNIHVAYLSGRTRFGNAKAVKKCPQQVSVRGMTPLPAGGEEEAEQEIRGFRRCWQSLLYTSRSSFYANGTYRRCRHRAC
ncbi:hypothetical protein FE241_14780 [Raoultella terrigena]|nr:hypothetical protein [Raoultella terrigena]